VPNLKMLLESRRSGEAAPLLKGSDIPTGTRSITIIVAAIRESPESFNAPAIIDLKKPIQGKTAWAVNKTNLKAIIKKFGDDDKKLVNQKIKLDVATVPNPQTGELVPGLVVSSKQ
jgi:hypothetical protein